MCACNKADEGLGQADEIVMDGYLGLPVSIWMSVLLPYLGIHDALALRRVSAYSRRTFPALLEGYAAFSTQCKDSILSQPLFAQAKAEFQRLVTQAYDFFSSSFDRREANEIRACKMPPESVRETMAVWVMLLTGHKPRDPAAAFGQCRDYLGPLQTLSKVPDRELMRSFLAAHTAQELNKVSSMCCLFVKYLEMLAQADDVRTGEFEDAETRLAYWQREEAVCLRLKQPKTSS